MCLVRSKTEFSALSKFSWTLLLEASWDFDEAAMMLKEKKKGNLLEDECDTGDEVTRRKKLVTCRCVRNRRSVRWRVRHTRYQNRLPEDWVLPKKRRADKKSINSIAHALDLFLACSGLTINNSKSVVWFSPNSNDDSINATLAKLQIPRACNLGSYLGFPLGMKGNSSDFQPILQKIKKRMDSWNTRFLSTAGKVTLLNSVVSPMAGFYMQCIPFPVKFKIWLLTLDPGNETVFPLTYLTPSKIKLVPSLSLRTPLAVTSIALFCGRGINVPAQCPLSGHLDENISHLLMECLITNLIWVKINICPASTSFSSWLKSNATNETSSTLNIPIGTIFIYCLWHIWLGRNQCVFNNQTFTPQVILKCSLVVAAEYFHLNPHPSPLQRSDSILLKWQPPPHNWWKLNTDGACSGNPGLFAIGDLIQNHNGTFISGFSNFIGYGTAFTAELWAITKLITSITLLLLAGPTSRDLQNFKILHSYMEGNGCADSLAKQALLSQSPTFESIPSHIRLSFLADIHGVHYARNVSSTSAL
ncbi:reverse transcriptase [Senna tora]|uniref:Reverse transcriptase n=1 Tax=Senna tora TaxID=362788 RepID=A0A834T5B0_9FABA|nr:reverse transcriptase [Senna tora]